MNPSPTDDLVSWEAHRVAAAFGVEKWGRDVWFVHSTASLFSGRVNDIEVSWRISPQGQIVQLRVGNGGAQDCIVALRGTKWWATFDATQHHYMETMARGLYRLGFEGESVPEQLNSPLSAHEKMELRLDMPREFWPTHWLEEAVPEEPEH